MFGWRLGWAGGQDSAVHGLCACPAREGSLGHFSCRKLRVRLRVSQTVRSPACLPCLTLPQVDLRELYSGQDQEAAVVANALYHLRSMVCYFGQHYLACVWADDLSAWLIFDDARVTRVGAWADVRRKCEAGHIQPSVLFYEAQTAAA